VIDMAARLGEVGGLDRLATVIAELAGDGLLHADAFARCAMAEPGAALRPAGWMVERFSDVRLDQVAAGLGSGEPVRLDPFGERRGSVDRRWGIRVNADVDPES